jgi:hypothetical protein
LSSVDSTPITSKRFLMVPELSSGGQDALAGRDHCLGDLVEGSDPMISSRVPGRDALYRLALHPIQEMPAGGETK